MGMQFFLVYFIALGQHHVDSQSSFRSKKNVMVTIGNQSFFKPCWLLTFTHSEMFAISMFKTEVKSTGTLTWYLQIWQWHIAEGPYNSRRLGKQVADEFQHKNIHCHQNRTEKQTSYKLHGHTLDNVESSKYLDVTIDNNLSWDRQIDNIVCKENKMLVFIRRNLRLHKTCKVSSIYSNS